MQKRFWHHCQSRFFLCQQIENPAVKAFIETNRSGNTVNKIENIVNKIDKNEKKTCYKKMGMI